MEKQQLIEEIRAYLRHIIFASDCLSCYRSIIDASRDRNDQINLSPGFFSISMHALSKCLCIELAKLYDHKTTEKTIYALVGVVKANQHLFPKKKDVSYLWDDPVSGVCKDETVKIDIKADLADAEEQLSRLETIIGNLKSRRDQYLAHNDPKYFDGTINPAWDFPIAISDVETLIFFAAGFCNKLLSYLDDTIMAYRSSNSNDLENLLQRIR